MRGHGGGADTWGGAATVSPDPLPATFPHHGSHLPTSSLLSALGCAPPYRLPVTAGTPAAALGRQSTPPPARGGGGGLDQFK